MDARPWAKRTPRNTLGVRGEIFVPPLWQAMQSCSFGAAQQPRRPTGVVRRMAGDAGIGRHRGVASHAAWGVILSADRACALVAQSASGFTLPADLPGGIVAGQAHLAAGAVAHQKILRHNVSGLHVRIVARDALDVATDQLHGSGGVCGLASRTSEAARSMLSFKGNARLNGCDVCMLLPKTSAGTSTPQW